MRYCRIHVPRRGKYIKIKYYAKYFYSLPIFSGILVDIYNILKSSCMFVCLFPRKSHKLLDLKDYSIFLKTKQSSSTNVVISVCLNLNCTRFKEKLFFPLTIRNILYFSYIVLSLFPLKTEKHSSFYVSNIFCLIGYFYFISTEDILYVMKLVATPLEASSCTWGCQSLNSTH